jgi:hypothetical protein
VSVRSIRLSRHLRGGVHRGRIHWLSNPHFFRPEHIARGSKNMHSYLLVSRMIHQAWSTYAWAFPANAANIPHSASPAIIDFLMFISSCSFSPLGWRSSAPHRVKT